MEAETIKATTSCQGCKTFKTGEAPSVAQDSASMFRDKHRNGRSQLTEMPPIFHTTLTTQAAFHPRRNTKVAALTAKAYQTPLD